MKYRIKQILAIMTAVMLLLNTMPVSALADASGAMAIMNALKGAGVTVEKQLTIYKNTVDSANAQIVTVRGVNGQKIDPGSPIYVTDTGDLNMDWLVAQRSDGQQVGTVAYFAIKNGEVVPTGSAGQDLSGNNLVALEEQTTPTVVTAEIGLRELTRVTTYDYTNNTSTDAYQLYDDSDVVISLYGQVGDTFALTNLTDGSSFILVDEQNAYQGACTKVQVVQDNDAYKLAPLDSEGNVSSYAVGKVVEHKYAFEFPTTKLPQQYAEDDGSAWLWRGNTEAEIAKYVSSGSITIPANYIGQIFYASQLTGTDPLGIVYATNQPFYTGEKQWIGRFSNINGQRNGANLTNYLQVSAYKEKVAYYQIVKDGTDGAKLVAVRADGTSADVADTAMYVP